MLNKNKLLIFVFIVILGAISLYGSLFLYKNKNSAVKNENKITDEIIEIIAKNPKPEEVIISPLFIKGEAKGTWFFEASFPAELYDENGFLLGIGPVEAKDNWMTENFVPFEKILRFSVPSSQKGILFFKKDNPSGLPQYDKEIKIPVIFQEFLETSEDTMSVNIFLNDSRYTNEPYFDCAKTAPFARMVPKTKTAARAALLALLRGPTVAERNNGFISVIPAGTRLNKITIENGTAKADFDEQLQFQAGGSCHILALRSQIEDTLKQFPAVLNVVISINGKTEEILEP